MQTANAARTPPTHTPPGPTPGHFLPCSARPRCLRSPLSRRYLCRLLPRWGPAASSPATAPGAGSAWGRGYAGGGTAARGRGRPGSLRRREAQRAGTGSLAAGSLNGCPTTGPAQPSKLSGLQSLAEKQEQMYLPSKPTGRARPGQLVLSSIPEQSKCSGSAAIYKHSARKHWALPYTRSRVFLEHLRQVSSLTYNWRNRFRERLWPRSRLTIVGTCHWS